MGRGDLQGNTILSHHLSQFAPEIKRFIEINQWALEKARRSDATFDIAPELVGAVTAAAAKKDALLALLSTALTTVTAVSELENTAVHEAGHAIVSLALRPEIRMAKVTVVEEGNAAGYVSFDEDSAVGKRVTSREDAYEQICVSLAGRAAQIRKFGLGAADAGAMSDMDKATSIAFHAVALLGLDDDFGPISLDVVAQGFNKISGLNDSHQIGRGYLFDEAQRRIQALIKDAYRTTMQILENNWPLVEELTALLLEKRPSVRPTSACFCHASNPVNQCISNTDIFIHKYPGGAHGNSN